LVLIGASTGGPQALVALMSGLAPLVGRLPVCVTLHMPPDLMPVIAAHVARVCQVETSVVTERRRLDVGVVYFAPGDRHLNFRRTATGMDVILVASAPGEFCRPAIDVMFASGAASHKMRTVGIVLSGMGKDGLEGARAIVAAGGAVLVQDKATSAVWGMPGAVAKADLAASILPPAAIARQVIERVGGPGRLP
jgi:two-component system chemotaxis response regulator CheB